MSRFISFAFAALAAAATLALSWAPLPAQAQTWPSRSVKFILPIGPGAGVDITARMLADKLSAKWGQPVVVENRPGGDAFVAITAVISGNDDHVLLFAPASTFTAHPLLHEKLPYKIEELIPAARATNTIIGLGVPVSLGVNNMKEFVDKVRAEPGKLNYASATGANDLLFASFLKTENLNMSRVPYRDTVQAVTDLAEGRVHAYVGAYAILRPHIQSGKIKMLASDQHQAGAATAGRADRGSRGLQGADHGRPHRPVRPAQPIAGRARPHRRRPARGDRRPGDHRAARRRPARWSIPATRRSWTPTSRNSA